MDKMNRILVESSPTSCQSCESCFPSPVRASLALELKASGSEVREKTDLNISRGEIVYELQLMSLDKNLHRLVFDEDTTLYQHIRTEIAHGYAVVEDTDEFLALNAAASLSQLVSQGVLVNRL